MEKTQKTLMTAFIVILVLVLLWVVLNETGILESGSGAVSDQAEFINTTIMEIATLGGAFLGLKMFKFKAIHAELVSQKAPALLKWGLLRLALIELPMLSNTIFYYMYMKPTFAYLAIILLLCLPFVWPSMGRCLAETEEDSSEQNPDQA